MKRGGAMWRTTIHSQGLEVETPLRTFIEDLLEVALVGYERRVGHVHVRLYGDLDDNGVHTCYVRVDLLPSGGVARGEAARDLRVAVERAVTRIGRAVRSLDEQQSVEASKALVPIGTAVARPSPALPGGTRSAGVPPGELP